MYPLLRGYDEDLAHPQAFHPPCEHVAVDGIPIAEQVCGRGLFREALDQSVSGQGAKGDILQRDGG
jgi:hypothetical protein